MKLALLVPIFMLPLVASAAEPDASLKIFLARFADMAAHGEADSMAKLTRFPLRNRVYQAPDRIGAAGFRRYFTRNGFRELAPCLKAGPPQRAKGRSADPGEWEVDCDGNVFSFVREGEGWRFSGFENVNE